MKLITLVTALAAVMPAVLSLTINSPASLVVCEPTQLSWSGGTSPYYLEVLPGGQISATPLRQFPAQNGTTYTWKVDIATGTSVTIAVKDSSGTSAYTSTISITSGTDSSCLNGTASSGSTTTSSVTGTTAASPTTATDTSGDSTTTSTSATSTATSSHSGAGRLGAASSAIGIAGVVGLIGAMFF